MEKKKLTETDVKKVIDMFFKSLKDSGDFFDVDMLIFYVTKSYSWESLFIKDDENLVNFNVGVMMFCQSLDAVNWFGAAGCVVLFTELNEWAKEHF